MIKFISVSLIFATLLLLTSCSSINTDSTNHSDGKTNITTLPATPTPSAKIGLNEIIRLGKYEVKFIGASVCSIKDKTSEYEMAIALSLEIKNISINRINLLSIDMPAYDPAGNEVQTQVVGQFFSDALDFTKYLDPEESFIGVYYIGYTLDGEYTIEVFDTTSDLFYFCVNIDN